MEKKYKLPSLCWLRVTDFLTGWITYELGGNVRVNGQRVISVQHLDGARALLRMETTNDTMEPCKIAGAMSPTRYNCIVAGMKLSPDVVHDMYGIAADDLKQFIPIECPRLTLTDNGVLRPWNADTCFSQKQASGILRLLREAFWHAVGEFSEQYASEHRGERYAQEDMIEAFCIETDTNDCHIPSIRREWQRRVKRERCAAE